MQTEVRTWHSWVKSENLLDDCTEVFQPVKLADSGQVVPVRDSGVEFGLQTLLNLGIERQEISKVDPQRYHQVLFPKVTTFPSHHSHAGCIRARNEQSSRFGGDQTRGRACIAAGSNVVSLKARYAAVMYQLSCACS